MAPTQDDFKGVAKALVKMGATDVKIDTDKFGNDLAEVVNRIMSLEPQIAITTDEVGMLYCSLVSEEIIRTMYLYSHHHNNNVCASS
jgi:predicted unusual protein kinase regulating ubiquinone biosynthesis (AarF/ABC1/UbiB family)